LRLVFFLREKPSWKIIEIFTHEFTIYQSDIDWWNHTNHAVIIQFFEDALYFAKGDNRGFSHAHNRKIASIPIMESKIEYINQSYPSQKIKVTLWPLFSEDLQDKNFTRYSDEKMLENSMVGFGGEIRGGEFLVSRAMLLYQIPTNNKNAKL